MKRELLLLAYLQCYVVARSADHRLGSKPKFYGSGYNSWSDSNTCFKEGSTFQDNTVDDEIEEEIADLNMQATWNGQKVVYRIDNLPKCTDIKDAATIKRLINEAAKTWNSVEKANIMLVNVDDIERSNEIDNNNEVDDSGSEDEFSNDTEELNYAGVDIIVSFEPCTHLKYRDKKPNAFLEDYGDECKRVYAHAHFFGDIHFNELMTWTERVFSEDDLKFNDYLKPNLYSIALHEFGHSLGLRHSTGEKHKDDVMYWDFSGMRKYSRLELTENDVSRLQRLYPVKDKCKDNVGLCSLNKKEYCNHPEKRVLCSKTCGLCECVDDYMKCSESVCSDPSHPMRPFCRGTCKLCGPENLIGKCTGLPSNISRLRTDEKFPIEHGTQIKVRCEDGYKIDGDEELTCEAETTYSWEEEEPECEPIDKTTGCIDLRLKNCKRLQKLKPSKFEKKCKKPVWMKSCRQTCDACRT